MAIQEKPLTGAWQQDDVHGKLPVIDEYKSKCIFGGGISVVARYLLTAGKPSQGVIFTTVLATNSRRMRHDLHLPHEEVTIRGVDLVPGEP